MASVVYPPATREIGSRRRELAPRSTRRSHIQPAGSADGALPAKTKQLIAVAAAHVTNALTASGSRRACSPRGASDEEIMEAIWVAAEMRAGGAFAHSTVALHALAEEQP